MATGWDGSKGVLDGSVGWGSIDRSIPGPPSGVKQAAYFIKMGYNTCPSDDTVDGVSLAWPAGHYWGLLFGDVLPETNEPGDSDYYDFFGVREQADTASSYDDAHINTNQSVISDAEDYGSPCGGGGTSSAVRFELGRGIAGFGFQADRLNGGEFASSSYMVASIPRDPSVNGVLVINIVASQVDETVTAEVWLCPEDIDFSAINFASIDLSNLASVFPNTNGWYRSMEVNGSAETGTNWRPESGVLNVPDRFVARFPVGAQKMEIYNTAYAYGN